MSEGVVSDIREFAVHDGPGLRTTVFLKGCPLRCSWCHNPEAQSPEPQEISAAGDCRLVGRRYQPAELAAILTRQAAILSAIGGVTFSGGEPLMQADFLCEVIDLLPDLHILLDTSGYAPAEDFRRVAGRCHMVHYDLKLIDPEAHRRFTGCDNTLIVENLCLLAALRVPYVVRVPLVPGVTDTDDNLTAIASLVRRLSGLLYVELLPFNRAAGGKYGPLGMRWLPGFDESVPPRINKEPFLAAGVPVRS
jgi:pyruvate formate lyase activating enzyme